MTSSDLPPGRCVVPAEADQFIRALRSSRVVVCDLETTGFDAFGKDRIIGFALRFKDAAGTTHRAYWPTGHSSLWQTTPNLPADPVIDALQGKPVWNWNTKFDARFKVASGWKPGPISCLMGALHLLDENRFHYRLKPCAVEILGASDDEETELLGKIEDKGKMYTLCPTEVAPYAVKDCDLVVDFSRYCLPRLHEQGLGSLYHQYNVYLSRFLRAETRGIQVDPDEARRLSKVCDQKMLEAAVKVKDLSGGQCKVSSPASVRRYLGLGSSKKEVLEDMVKKGLDDPKFIAVAQTTLDYRSYMKLQTSFFDVVINGADSNMRVHPSFSLHRTVTGRPACSRPPLQGIPKYDPLGCRGLFVASDGYVLLSADYSQAELRLASHFAPEPVMARLLREGADIHSETATSLGVPRDYAKRVNFSVVYGIGAKSLSENLKISEGKARTILRKYHSKYRGFRQLYYRMESMAKRQGYIQLPTGRRRRYPDLRFCYKASSNFVQGTVAEILRLATGPVQDYLDEIGGHLLLSIHDQLMMEIPIDCDKQRVISRIRELMEHPQGEGVGEFNPPLKVDVSTGANWANLVEVPADT